MQCVWRNKCVYHWWVFIAERYNTVDLVVVSLDDVLGKEPVASSRKYLDYKFGTV